jgi:hypothetical protein
MLAERGKSLAVRETAPATGRALHPLRLLLKTWMNGPGGLVARASRDEIFAGVEAYGYSELDAQGLVLNFTAVMITSVAKELPEREVVRQELLLAITPFP